MEINSERVKPVVPDRLIGRQDQVVREASLAHPPRGRAEPEREQKRHSRISAIVPAYNEEATVGMVLDVLLRCGRVDEVVCVNDGSTDRTLEVLRTFGAQVTLVDLQPNRGKGHALAEGIRRASGDVVVFIDADLVNLTSEHVTALLEPITAGRSRAVLGSLGGDFLYSMAKPFGTRISDPVGSVLSGQRAYHRQDLLAHAARMEATRFGVEVFLNAQFSKADTAVVVLPGLTALGKHEKHGWSAAVREYSGELREVASEMARTGWARLAR